MWTDLEQNYNIDEITRMEDELRDKALVVDKLKEEIVVQKRIVS